LGHLKISKISWIHTRKKNQNIHDVLSNKRKNSLQFSLWGASNLSQVCSLASINNYFLILKKAFKVIAIIGILKSP
jgi:hypothetical protein